MAVISLAATTYLSDRIGKRAIVAICIPVPVIIGYAIAIGTPNVGAGYFAMFLCSTRKYSDLSLSMKPTNSLKTSQSTATTPYSLHG